MRTKYLSFAVILFLDLSTFSSFTSILKVNPLVDLQYLEPAVDPLQGVFWLQESPWFMLKVSV